MPQITYTARYRKNQLSISSEELMLLYFYGVNILSKDGSDFSDENVRFYIQSAQLEIEKHLGIKIMPEFITESQDYYRDDYFNNFPYVKVTYPVTKPYAFIGMINSIEQIIFPQVWLSVRKNSSNNTAWRQVNIVPNGSMVSGNSEVIYTGALSYYGMFGNKKVPDYWTIQYSTGFSTKNYPYDIMNIIGMLAAIPILAIAGDLILGAGISSTSLGIDGLSQSFGTPLSATSSAYGARITEYRKTITETLDQLKKNYRGIGFTVC